MNIDELLDRISELYKSGDELTPDLVSELQNVFSIRDELSSIMSLDLESTSKKMKDLLVANGYTIDSLERIKPYVNGNDVYKLNAFIASMKEEKNEFYISSAVYYNKILNETADFYMYDAFNSCVSKLVDRGYSKKNVMKSIFDYSSNGTYDLGESKGVVVRLVKSKAPIIQDAVKKDVVEDTMFASKKEPLTTTDGEMIKGSSENAFLIQSLNSNVVNDDVIFRDAKKLMMEHPDLSAILSGVVDSTPEVSTSIEDSVTSPSDRYRNSAGELGYDIGHDPVADEPIEMPKDGQSIDFFNSDSQIPIVDYTVRNDDYALGTFDSEEMPNPFEIPYEGPLKKISKIAKKVKRKITKPDFNKLKMKMLKSFMKLMSIDSNVLKQPQSDSIYTDYSFDDDININGRSR